MSAIGRTPLASDTETPSELLCHPACAGWKGKCIEFGAIILEAFFGFPGPSSIRRLNKTINRAEAYVMHQSLTIHALRPSFAMTGSAFAMIVSASPSKKVATGAAESSVSLGKTSIKPVRKRVI
jgi:hypothetical protein